jgi:hypothetical protein
MPLYFLLVDATRFHQDMRPALAASWRQRSFEPCRALCTGLAPAAVSFTERYGRPTEGPFLCQVARGLAFHPDFWNLLVGEVLLHGAAAMSEVQADPDTLCCLLAGAPYEDSLPRERFAPVHQALFGARELTFGAKYYRPLQAGCNDSDDVSRLVHYLRSVRPERWTVADLQALSVVADDGERAEELEMARDWFPSLRELYVHASQQGHIVVREIG